MSRFNTSSHKAKPAVATATSPLGTTRGPADTRTFEGGAGWTKDAKTDLFLRASASFTDGKGTFYESGATRDQVLLDLAAKVAVEDFAWFAQFVKWLRRAANIRTAALMIAAAGVKARVDAGLVAVGEISNRIVIDSVLYRADEPGELLAFWTATYGRRIPKPVKRGVADAVRRLYNERSLLKYDTASKGYRFGDVLNLAHPDADADKAWQGDLFKYALDRRHNPDTAVIPESLGVLQRNKQLREADDLNLWLDTEFLNSAGVTWENVLSAVGDKVDKKKLWEAMIPSMGYMALLRNLRNFDESGVSNQVANQVIVKLVREDEVAKSRQLPFRFYSAYNSAPSLRWANALETALDLCLPNIPTFTGRTLVLIDTSGSMTWYDNAGGKGAGLKCMNAAALFGSALALKNQDSTTLVTFDTNSQVVQIPKGGSVLRLTDHIVKNAHGGATYTQRAIDQHYDKHDRVIILTDEQSHIGGSNDVAGSVPKNVPVYAFCLVGYSASAMPTGEAARFQLGGLSDQTFKLIPLLEQGGGNLWPWQVSSS